MFEPSSGWFDPSIHNRVWVTDVNGDGLPDILGTTSSGLYWQLNTGSGFGPTQSQADNRFNPSVGWFDRSIHDRVWVTDMNGDGSVDILGATDSGLYWQTSAGSDSVSHENLLLSISDGVGGRTAIGYRPLTNSSIYTKDRGSAYPTQDIQLPIYAVSSLSSSNGLAGTLTTYYKYGGLKTEWNGRGLLGFRWMESTQVETGITTRTEFRQDWPYIGLPSLVTKTMAGGGNAGVLSQVSTSYACLSSVNSNDATLNSNPASCGVAAGRRYFPYMSASSELSWDLNGAALPTVTTESKYDVFGNPTKISVSASDGYSKTTSNTYTNDTANWFLGRLTKAIVTSSAP